jgi:hypothetical protein
VGFLKEALANPSPCKTLKNRYIPLVCYDIS